MSEPAQFEKEKLEKFHHFLMHCAYWHGFAIGVGAAMKSARATKDTSDGIRYLFFPDEISSFTPGFAVLEFRWFYWYGSFRVAIDLSRKAQVFMKTVSLGQLQRANERDYVNEFRIYDRNNPVLKDINRHIALVDAIEAMTEKYLVGIQILNSFRSCFYCGDLRIVETTVDKWLCETCQSRFSLNAAVTKYSTDNKQQKSEREKMTRKLRFKILERDNFRCKACGADPREDSSVTLQVDHIIPIALGGKTTEDNLQALCRKCNQGKGTDKVEQMSLWD